MYLSSWAPDSFSQQLCPRLSQSPKPCQLVQPACEAAGNIGDVTPPGETQPVRGGSKGISDSSPFLTTIPPSHLALICTFWDDSVNNPQCLYLICAGETKLRHLTNMKVELQASCHLVYGFCCYCF